MRIQVRVFVPLECALEKGSVSWGHDLYSPSPEQIQQLTVAEAEALIPFVERGSTAADFDPSSLQVEAFSWQEIVRSIRELET